MLTSGTWDVYVVNQEAQPGGLPVSLTQTADLTASGFGNLAAVNGANVKVATIAVAVPEPASLAFAGVVVMATAARTIRRGHAPRERRQS
ncbi:MAG: PEP-CTERM sorting domain-containing protein [Planctomycetaceae bacterium]